MKPSLRIVAALLLAGAALFLNPANLGGRLAYADEARTLRPEIARALQAAADALKAKRGKDALARLADTNGVQNKTAYESFMIERTRGQAAVAVGDTLLSARSFEQASASSAASDSDKKMLLGAAAGQYYSAREYSKAVELANRYHKIGGADPAVHALYLQALYLSGDARAAREILSTIQAEERGGRSPSETNLQLLANAALKQQDNVGYLNAMEKLVAHYPKKEYWLALVHGVTGRGLPERLVLDAARLKLATGTLRTAEEYTEGAQLAIQAGFPLEAKKFIDAGYAANLLGNGADADRHRRLKDLVAKNVQDDTRTLGQDDAQVLANKDGTAQLNAGFNYLLHGKADKGLDMMEKGLAKGGSKRPEDVRLRLGVAYYLAGKKVKALQAFKSIPEEEPAPKGEQRLTKSSPTAALARLWVIRLGQAAP